MELPQRILTKLFESRNLYLVDPLKYMRDNAEGGTVMYGYVDSHLNSIGHSTVAEYILPIINNELNIKLSNE